MKFFFSCDWGTSTFRLRLVDTENERVLSTIKTAYGIATAFECWQQTNLQEESRQAFFETYLLEQVNKITMSFNEPLHDAPIILSGMASSSIGMMELPYKQLPFRCSGADLVVHFVKPLTNNGHKIIIISGASSEVDVLRGEETILAGCDITELDTEQIFIFPGTHSKHIIVENGLVKNITTYMTGELFDLLSNKSILSPSVKKNEEEQTATDPHFIDGVIKGRISNLLNSIFHVRTNQLFKKATAGGNYNYLSGLLIGYELKDIAGTKPSAITLVCGEAIKEVYMQAFNVIGLSDCLRYKNADDALVKGQWAIMRQTGSLT
ncbi:MAG: 2-dehydro-3-deoxygalactonokinase [Ferruginibacter sp.]|nr:2-dehydro-3-deoxygalactonokinase [Ferruginibacter sp.]